VSSQYGREGGGGKAPCAPGGHAPWLLGLGHPKCKVAHRAQVGWPGDEHFFPGEAEPPVFVFNGDFVDRGARPTLNQE